MSNYLNDNLNQSVFLDVNYLEVLGENTFEFCLYELITKVLDLDEFHQRYKNKNVGRKAYPPALLLRVIFYAYYRGITSSRSIERSCKTDLKFMALASGLTPHFTTIADFVSGNCDAMKVLFHKTLMICCQSGLVGKEHFAIDGCKLPSDASKHHANLSRKSLKLKKSAHLIIERHCSNDNDKISGDKDRELKTVDTLIKNAQKIDQFLSENEKRIGVGKRKKEVQSNITDNESTKMTTSKGTIQGYNCQAVSDELHQIVVATQVFGIGQDQSLLKPMVDEIKNHLGQSVFSDNTLLTADTGYSSEANMAYLYTQEINAVVPDTNFRQRAPQIGGSQSVAKHKAHRQKTRNDRSKSVVKIPASEFFYDRKTNQCVCPNDHTMLFQGDQFYINNKRYSRFKSRLNNCRQCPKQALCMKRSVTEHGRQVSFVVEEKDNLNYLDLMKRRIDSDEGKREYAKRMWTIEPVFEKGAQ